MRYFHKIVVSRVSPFFDLDVDGPTLVRINDLFTAAGAPINSPTTGGAIWLAAWPYTEIPPGDTTDARMSRAWRGTGPMIYLPFAGRWQVNINISLLGGVLLPAFNKAELSLISMPPELAGPYLQAPPASYHLSTNFSVAAGAGFNVFSASGLDLAAQVWPAKWFNLCRFAMVTNVSPITDFKVALGRTAAAGVGSVLPGFNRRLFEWQEIAGQTVFVFNNTAGAVDVCVEAHFL